MSGRGGLLAVVVWGSAALAQEPKLAVGGDASKGQLTYKQVCASCHGDKGLGNGPAAIALNPKPKRFTDPEVVARLTPDWVYTLVKDGGAAHGKSPLMVPMIAALTEGQLRDVAAYTLTLVPAVAAPHQK
jgi:mono/diheme cytochrome c family protein